MRGIPESYAQPPDGASPLRLLAWVCRRQWRSIAAGTFYDVVWLLGLALTPWAIGKVIDLGLVAQDAGAFALWISVVIWLQLQHSLVQGLRDRAGILNFRRGFARIYQLVTRTAARNATAAEREVTPGALATMATFDAFAIGFLPIMIGGFTAALVSYAVVGVLLIRDSTLLGLLVLVGVPLFSGALLLLVRPLERRQSEFREAVGRMNDIATDSIRGLRVLRGIGGERAFVARYVERSRDARTAGVRVAWPVAGIQAIELAVTGTLLVGLTWIGAALVVAGRLQVGELVAFFGYAGFMVLPVRLAAGAVNTGVQSYVAARRIVDLRRVAPLVGDADGASAPAPASGGVRLEDLASGVHIDDGRLLGLASGTPADARAVADRLARLVPDDAERVVRIDGRDAASLPVAAVRERVVVSDPVPFLFSGTLRSLLDPRGAHSDAVILAAADAAEARDVIDSVPSGLDTEVGERAREFSGGQRQRLGLVRALLVAPHALVLLDPTSSVDAVTEAQIAGGIRAHRAGRTTILSSTSPLVLGETDRVAVLDDGVVRIAGSHDELIRSDEAYRAVVLRGTGES